GSMLTQIPSGLNEIIHTFGSIDDPKFEAENIVSFNFPYTLRYAGQPVTRSRCHKLAIDNFVTAFDLIKAAGLEDLVMEFNGIYNRRPIRGYESHPSTHSWGIAIDVDASHFKLGSVARLPDGIVNCFRKAGFFYGGDFKGRKDPMHFQLAVNY
ncbi:MAG TPA: M15 family metallopeptidase, partial [Blastocatellia bacterium]